MKAILDHTAFSVKEYEWYKNFFMKVFGMEIRREIGEEPCRQLWLSEGIQLNETNEENPAGGVFHHICFHCEKASDGQEIVASALKEGCSAVDGKPHWFQLPNGIMIEMK